MTVGRKDGRKGSGGNGDRPSSSSSSSSTSLLVVPFLPAALMVLVVALSWTCYSQRNALLFVEMERSASVAEHAALVAEVHHLAAQLAKEHGGLDPPAEPVPSDAATVAGRGDEPEPEAATSDTDTVREGSTTVPEKCLLDFGLPLAQLELVGELFMRPKVSEMLIKEETLAKLPQSQQEKIAASASKHAADSAPFLAKVGVDLLSVPFDADGSKGDGDRTNAGVLSAASAEATVERMQRWGVAVLQNAISPRKCRSLAKKLQKAIVRPTYPFGSIMESQLRVDYPLAVDADSAPFLEEVIKLLKPALDVTVGPDAWLVELSSLISFPGADAQAFHPDAGMKKTDDLKKWSKVYSIFVYLDDVDATMAALDLQPGTHTHYHFLDAKESKLLQNRAPFVRAVVPCGSIIIMDSRTIHRGSANDSPRVRPVFYFSVMAKKGEVPTGPTYSLRAGYTTKFTIADIAGGKTLQTAQHLSDAAPKGFEAALYQMVLSESLARNGMILNKEGGLEGEGLEPKVRHALRDTLRLQDKETKEATMIAAFSEKAPLYKKKYTDNSKVSAWVMDPPVVSIKTSNYAEEIERHFHTIVCFFDPRAASYKLNKHEFEMAAKTISQLIGTTDSAWHNANLSFAAINSASNSFLTTQIANEMNAADQTPIASSDKSFEFGYPNFTPIIFHLFTNGTQRREYTGLVKSSDIVEWLERVVLGSGKLSVAAMNVKMKQGTMLAVLCAPANTRKIADARASSADDGTTLADKTKNVASSEATDNDDRGSDTDDAGGSFVAPAVSKEAAFRQLQLDRPDLIDYVVLDSDALCYSVLGPDASSGDAYFLHKATIQTVNWTLPDSYGGLNKTFATEVYQQLLLKFLDKMQAGSAVHQLTPDNSHVFLDKLEPLVVLLLHSDASEKTENDRVKRVLLTAAKKLGCGTLQLTWADGVEFGPQFEVSAAKSSMPALLLVEMLSKPGEDTIRKYPSDLGKKITVGTIEKWINATGVLHDYKTAESTMLTSLSDTLAQVSADPISTAGAANKTADNPPSLLSKPNGEDENSKSPFAHLHEYQIRLGIVSSIRIYAQRLIDGSMQEDYQGQFEDAHILLAKASHLFETAHQNFTQFSPLVNTTEELQGLLESPNGLVRLRPKIEHASKQQKILLKYPHAKFALDVVQANTWLAEELTALIKGEEGRFAARTNSPDSIPSQLDSVTGEESSRHAVPPVQIDRRDWTSLSLEEFYLEYAVPKKPVVITGLNVSTVPWSLDYFLDKCGKHEILLRKRDANTTNWGGLVNAEVLTVEEFVGTYTTNKTRGGYYLHDWSLPRNCPEAFGPPPYSVFQMPKYFAGDYFQRVYPNGYQHAWPSLFIGANKTQSDMHVDSGGTHFWLYLLNGTKEWRFFDQHSDINLYNIETTPKFAVDVFDPDLKAHPLYARAKMYTAVQQPGDLMFIPAGCPHAVRNLNHIHAISMNYVDPSNYFQYLHENLKGNNFRQFELFTNEDLILGLNRSQENIPFGEFKAQQWMRVVD